MELLADRDVAKVFHASWQELLEVVPSCDALIVDAPYSERTHGSHDAGAGAANRAHDWATKHAGDQGNAGDNARMLLRGRGHRRTLSYACWTPEDVAEFVGAWAPRTDGWFVSLTDHVLVPAWADALETAGRYVFSPIACVEPGSRVRMVGDGPAQWSCFAVVARPKAAPYSKWGALPGAYVVPSGYNPRPTALGGAGKSVTGGKPQWLMERLVEDYSRPGQLVVDPCCGAGTTVTAAIRTGRRAVGGDAMREHAELAAKAVGGMQQAPLFCGGAA